MGGCEGKGSVDGGCGSEVTWERIGGGEEEYGSGFWGGFAIIALSTSRLINPNKMLFRRFLVLAEVSSWARRISIRL